MGNFSGMLFTLKKREQSISEDDSKLYKQLILGYYDGLDIHTVDKWYNLRPKGLLKRKLQVDLDSPYIDQYTIRALIPDNRDELEKLGFSYGLWEKIGLISSGEYEKRLKDIRRRYPFVCMSLLNVTENFVREQENLQQIQDLLIAKLRDCINSAGYAMEEIHCAVFPSIGYSDFIMLFMIDDLKMPAEIINRMKAATTDNDVAIISSCYSICGLDKIYFENSAPKLGENIRVSIEINLQGGISAGDFLDRLEEKIKNSTNSLLSNIEELGEFVKELKKRYYVTFGNSDCLLLPEQSLEQYLKWYEKGNILNPSSQFFKENIANVKTTVSIIEDENFSKCGIPLMRNTGELEEYKEKFTNFLGEYDEFLKKNYMPIRSSRAMRQIMKNFLNVAKSSHGFDIRKVVGDTFLSLINDMEYYMALEFRKNNDKIPEEIKSEKKYVVEVLEEFKEFMGLFISDLIRSDRPFIEGNMLTHSSIGSSTKLLFAYSAMLGKLAKKNGRENDFSFLVSSGGCDRTEAIDLFDFTGNNSGIKKPIFIIIPEMSLYDIQGTLFRILHEYMHFIGERRRKERYRFIVNALSEYIAWEITELDFNDQRMEELIEKAVYHLHDNMKKVMKVAIEKKWLELKGEAQKEIAEAISSQSVFSDYENRTEEEFYSYILKETVLHIETMVDIFSMTDESFTSTTVDSLQKRIYTVLYETDRQLVEFVTNELKDMKLKSPEDGKCILLPLQFYQMLLNQYEFRDKNPDEYDRKLRQFIEQYVSSLLRNFPLSTGGRVVFKAEYGYDTILEEIMTSVIESFSDCAAVCTIKMSVEDFLLSFIYEIWDIDQAFPETIGNTLRLGADLHVLYGVTGGLSDDIKNRVRKKAKERAKQGYKYQNVEEMLKRVNKILDRYCLPELAGSKREIEQYLRLCVGTDTGWYSDELGELYRACEMDTSEKIYEVVDKIICLWKSLSGEY